MEDVLLLYSRLCYSKLLEYAIFLQTKTYNVFFIAGDSKFDCIDLDVNTTCPDGLVWDEARLLCVYKFTDTGSSTSPGSGAVTGGTGEY